MDELILEESEDPAVVETGGKLNFVLGEYSKEDEIYEFSSNPDTKVGDMTVIVDDYGIYLVRLENFEEYDNSEDIKEKVKNDYLNLKFNEDISRISKEDKYLITYTNNELVDTIAGSDSIDEVYAQKMIAFTAIFLSMLANSKERKMIDVISKSDIQRDASNIFVVIQEEGNNCSFYAYTKTNDKWKEKFNTSGYVGRKGIKDEGKVEGGWIYSCRNIYIW